MTANVTLPLIPLDFLGYADDPAVPVSPAIVPAMLHAQAADDDDLDELDEDDEYDDEDEDDEEEEDDDELEDEDDLEVLDEEEEEEDEEEELEA